MPSSTMAVNRKQAEAQCASLEARERLYELALDQRRHRHSTLETDKDRELLEQGLPLEDRLLALLAKEHATPSPRLFSEDDLRIELFGDLGRAFWALRYIGVPRPGTPLFGTPLGGAYNQLIRLSGVISAMVGSRKIDACPVNTTDGVKLFYGHRVE